MAYRIRCDVCGKKVSNNEFSAELHWILFQHHPVGEEFTYHSVESRLRYQGSDPEKMAESAQRRAEAAEDASPVKKKSGEIGLTGLEVLLGDYRENKTAEALTLQALVMWDALDREGQFGEESPHAPDFFEQQIIKYAEPVENEDSEDLTYDSFSETALVMMEDERERHGEPVYSSDEYFDDEDETSDNLDDESTGVTEK